MTKSIAGVAFNISQPYAEGHTITAAEAKALNQVRAENIGNNVREAVKKFIEEGNEAAAHELVAKRDAEYVFNMSSASAARKFDPEETEARKIAKELIKEHLASTGRKLTVAPEGETEESWKEKIEAQIDSISTNPDVLKQAKKNVANKKKTSEQLLSAVGGVAV